MACFELVGYVVVYARVIMNDALEVIQQKGGCTYFKVAFQNFLGQP
jgi:hypothetical protein